MTGFERLYTNIGDKIKHLATWLFVLGSVFSIFFGIMVISHSYGAFGIVLCGVSYLILGPILSWMATWLLYGFGVLMKRFVK